MTMDMRTQKGRSRTGARCDLACVFAAIVIVGLSGVAGQIYSVSSPWFELSIGPDVGTHFNLTFFNALGNSSLSNKVSISSFMFPRSPAPRKRLRSLLCTSY